MYEIVDRGSGPFFRNVRDGVDLKFGEVLRLLNTGCERSYPESCGACGEQRRSDLEAVGNLCDKVKCLENEVSDLLGTLEKTVGKKREYQNILADVSAVLESAGYPPPEADGEEDIYFSISGRIRALAEWRDILPNLPEDVARKLHHIVDQARKKQWLNTSSLVNDLMAVCLKHLSLELKK